MFTGASSRIVCAERGESPRPAASPAGVAGRFLPWVCAAVMALPEPPLFAQADPGPKLDAQAAGNSPLLLLRPEARDLGAPEWVKPGTRITFHVMAGSSPEGGYSLDKDPNGTWEDPATGERYAKNDAVGAGGEGYGQYDIISVGREGVAMAGNLYGIVDAKLPPTLVHIPMGGMTAAAAGPADLWVHPALLDTSKPFHTPGFFVLKGDYRVGPKIYPSLCIVRREKGAYSSHAYDLKTGVLVSSTVTSEGRLAKLHLPGEDPQRGNRATHIVKLVGIRQLETPGLRGKNPAWVKGLKAMRFAGQGMYVNTFDPSVRMGFPASMEVTFGQRGNNWCAFQARTLLQIPGAPAQPAVVNGMCGPAGSFWIDPAALAKLRVGQVLDEDPHTRVRVAVTAGEGGAITITTQGPGVGGQGMYDLKTGMLQGIVALQPSSGITIHLQLQETE